MSVEKWVKATILPCVQLDPNQLRPPLKIVKFIPKRPQWAARPGQRLLSHIQRVFPQVVVKTLGLISQSKQCQIEKSHPVDCRHRSARLSLQLCRLGPTLTLVYCPKSLKSTEDRNRGVHHRPVRIPGSASEDSPRESQIEQRRPRPGFVPQCLATINRWFGLQKLTPRRAFNTPLQRGLLISRSPSPMANWLGPLLNVQQLLAQYSLGDTAIKNKTLYIPVHSTEKPDRNLIIEHVNSVRRRQVGKSPHCCTTCGRSDTIPRPADQCPKYDIYRQEPRSVNGDQ
ncbi:hypothetical protein RRG08_040069 [Elysia crispata]|uniref:Uncharacterized protein n=1 Tax=Elysia crispata TaxID=231223 RepID=A0AAE1CN16_9GAST|nr:hypothetical protein RRG08_040069 [Elysia crispata]